MNQILRRQIESVCVRAASLATTLKRVSNYTHSKEDISPTPTLAEVGGL